MRVAETIGQRSECSRDKVGAVIVSRDNRIIDSGYNGPPRGFYRVGGDCLSWCPRSQFAISLEPDLVKSPHATFSPTYEDCVALHAEQNALMFSDRRLREGGTIYVSSSVCGVCAKLIANSGLAQCVVRLTDNPHRNAGKWVSFMEQCGITVVELL